MNTKKMSESERQERNKKLVEREVLACQTGLVEEILKVSGGMLYNKTDLPALDDLENYCEYKCPECGHGEIDQDEFDNGKVGDDYPSYKCPYCEKELEHLPEDSEPQEILEWWLVTEWMYEKLRDKGEPVLNYGNFNYWWGRTCSGQAILLDSVIDKICDDLGW